MDCWAIVVSAAIEGGAGVALGAAFHEAPIGMLIDVGSGFVIGAIVSAVKNNSN